MKFLFIGPGYPGVVGADAGSGIGTYLRELALGLTARGHECHVLVWGTPPAAERESVESPEWRLKVSELLSLFCQVELASQHMSGVMFHFLQHSYWPIIEKFAPDSRDVYNLRQAVRGLDRRHGFDWIEIESEEGIAIGVQRDFSKKVVLRIHTTLKQMVLYKQVPASWPVNWRLSREARSFRQAMFVMTHSRLHAEEIRSLFALAVPVYVVPIGIQVPDRSDVSTHSSSSDAGDPSVALSQAGPRFLMVGTADRRKGFDRIRPVLEAFLSQYGPCELIVVSGCGDEAKRRFALSSAPVGVNIRWRSRLTDGEMNAEYANASVLLHLARYESFGLPFIEAAARGVPIVSTAVGVAPELLAGELESFLVDGDDPAACARALAEAVARRVAFGRELKQRYHAGFTRDIMTERYLDQIIAQVCD